MYLRKLSITKGWLFLLMLCLFAPTTLTSARRKARTRKRANIFNFERHTIPEDVEKGTHGVDLSHYQGYINWDQLVNDTRIGFVYLKATEGATIKDKYYFQNLRTIRRKYIPVGSYHFFVPRISPYAQFKNFTSIVKKETQDLLPVVDIETLGRTSPAVCRARLMALLRLLTRHYGKRPMVYTSYRFYKYVLRGHIGHYKLFIAYYKKGTPDIGRDFTLWQYSDRARFKGVPHPVDLNKFAHGYTLEDILLHPLPKDNNKDKFRSYEKAQRHLAPFSYWLRRPFMFNAQRTLFPRGYSIYR